MISTDVHPMEVSNSNAMRNAFKEIAIKLSSFATHYISLSDRFCKFQTGTSCYNNRTLIEHSRCALSLYEPCSINFNLKSNFGYEKQRRDKYSLRVINEMNRKCNLQQFFL